MKNLTEENVLSIARQRMMFVHRFSWRAEKLRKLTRRMYKDGKLTMARMDRSGFYYRAKKV